jgi:Co/Zn/Cd efflux system component
VLTDLQLNDVISLLVGLWAVKVANEKSNSKTYTYGVSNLVAVSRMAD